MNHLEVDLNVPPSDRWRLTSEQAAQARQLLNSYLADLGGIDDFVDLLGLYAASYVPMAHLREIEALASQIDCSREEALLVNLYYDAVKMIFGCTAFAVDTPEGPLLARNLDWWTENSMLARFTAVTAFHQDQRPFITVGWPGFVGALSGVAAGRFAVTLNAVLSEEPVQMATPISLYIRTVLEEAETYAQAVDMLAQEPIVSDCLLLVCGTKPGEMVVIERTPTRAALRKPEDGYIAVTNTYRLLNSVMVTPGTLAATTDARFETTCARLEAKRPTTPDTCFEILEAVRLPITVQQMVLRPSDGTALVRPAG